MAQYDTLSRYRNDASGQTASRLPADKRVYTTYVCVSGDTLESIATRCLGNPKRYWELADLNPQIKFPLDISVGTLLRLPV